MGKYFGTDGFRGEAGVTLTADHAYKAGCLGWYYGMLRQRNGEATTPRIVIGKDTRRSSYMFEYSLVAGLTASGADAYLLHVTTTPSVAYIARVDDFDCGIMIPPATTPIMTTASSSSTATARRWTRKHCCSSRITSTASCTLTRLARMNCLLKPDHVGCTVDYVSGRNR